MSAAVAKPLFKVFYGKYSYAFSKMRRLSWQGYSLVGFKLYPDNTYKFTMRRSDFKGFRTKRKGK